MCVVYIFLKKSVWNKNHARQNQSWSTIDEFEKIIATVIFF